MIAEIRSFITPNADLISISDEELPEWLVEQTMTSVSSDSDPCLSELASFDFNADLSDLEYLDSILDEEMDEEFPELLLEQTFTTDYDALLPEPVGSGFMADFGEMEFHDTYAPSMEYHDSMYDEEMINIDHLIADLNSTRDEGFLVTTDSDAFLPERCSPNFMANHRENEHQANYVHSMDYLA
ncbi:hypothetical protein M8C21_014082 [Ambrosia artemisiifolia]|uniref:Uncharacterized protein n=1 Tax=Ambrosia artemisiifolia TaxID=4212 RepID=A0AAD5GVD8_AMBAR|nr:hypothetical protein M8C21_014082 [Ambrosia artemisiifolia]